ncbi:MAG: TM2 domain-containing protein [Alphaproteobacteria bacterium]|nr:TM2 domain-containing protein [Alphaproteobacteria bacterium]
MSTALTTRKDTGIAYVLWMGGLLGVCGLHRIYMGRVGSGILWMLTGGLCGVGQLVDLILMPQMIDDSARGRGW